jgi:hypothetical protein
MKPFLNNRTYDFLKFVAQILLPAAGTFYFSLAGLWELPNADSVVGTIMAVDVFLGLLLGLSAKVYDASEEKYDGDVTITSLPDTPTKRIELAFKDEPEVLEGKKDVTFKVNVDGVE